MKTRLLQFMFCSLVVASSFGHAQSTTSNPTIALDHLDLLLDPLTKDELATEAEAWRDLVKNKVRAISAEEIARRETNIEIAQAAEQTATSDAQVEQQQEQKQESLDTLNVLREEKSALLTRFNAVLDAFAKKGGDPDEFRKYATAVSGIKVEVTDTSATWSAIEGWFTSKEGGVKWGLKTLQFIVIMIVFWVIARVIGSILRAAIENSEKISGLLKTFINKFITRTIIFVGFLVAISTMGVNVGALLALVGGGAFIIGFALQATLSNFAAGLMLLVYRPFDVGDIVQVGGVLGVVDNVSLVNTSINTFDNQAVIVPNGQVWGQVITNVTANDKRRVDMTFGISYSDDIDKAKGLIEKIVAAHELVLKDPEPVVRLHTLGESSVDFVCRPWTETANYWQVYWDITQAVKKTFDKEGVSIPFPQRDVHVYHTHGSDPEPTRLGTNFNSRQEKSSRSKEEFAEAQAVD